VRVELAYGRRGAAVEVPDDAEVVLPVDAPALADETGAVTEALRRPGSGPPLRDLVRGRARVAVVFPDLTRPMPNRTVLPPLLAELERCGVPADNITLLCATGTHRQATPAEMAELIGPDVVARYAVVDHDAREGDHVGVGEVDGTAVLLQREYVEADVRIVTGFVEPHFFAGFSGGPKAVCPGLAATETILEAHHPRRIADARATFVTRAGNPVHDFVRAATALAEPQFSVDVAINRSRRVTAVFAGALTPTHDAACAHVGASAVRNVEAPFDLVVSTNGGHPLDRNLYQAVKGMAAAERILRDRGVVVMAAARADRRRRRSRARPLAGPGPRPGGGAGRGPPLQRGPERCHHPGRPTRAGARPRPCRRRRGGTARAGGTRRGPARGAAHGGDGAPVTRRPAVP
jgi:nickel-dependent lactate racemase